MSLEKYLKQADKALDRNQLSIEKQIAQYYAQSLKEIRSQIATLEARGIFNQSDMFKYNRLTGLEENISKEISKLTGKTARTLQNGLGSLYKESYYRSAFGFEKTVNAKLSFTLLNPKVIEQAVKNPLDRIGWLARNRVNQQILARQIKEEITRGLLQGKGYRETTKAVKERMDVGATNVLRIVRTESQRVQNQGRLNSMEHAESKGVNMKKQWVSAIDSRTRNSHGTADGQIVNIDEPFIVGGEELMYPGDPAGTAFNVVNCRCSMISVIDGYGASFRRVRGEGIVPYTTFDEYMDNRF
ncbi:phage putative head morphogenesis protein, SPP1 gp7 family [Anaerovirgula multivorans]|uniref:Phage putative head morphogenesis protein, SPP1 gp7 family n=1 Tax=Anaerovirgula multivorans TaxID=312168 RepID=A0A239AIV8_9FIRM|nr:phage minor head protein [Anaerovirgula multivorans]SNR95606.1 phage putative head morphogenesis protein, SPP1 gp7 family [Anaerovirgula multivorans]